VRPHGPFGGCEFRMSDERWNFLATQPWWGWSRESSALRTRANMRGLSKERASREARLMVRLFHWTRCRSAAPAGWLPERAPERAGRLDASGPLLYRASRQTESLLARVSQSGQRTRRGVARPGCARSVGNLGGVAEPRAVNATDSVLLLRFCGKLRAVALRARTDSRPKLCVAQGLSTVGCDSTGAKGSDD